MCCKYKLDVAMRLPFPGQHLNSDSDHKLTKSKIKSNNGTTETIGNTFVYEHNYDLHNNNIKQK